MQTETSLSLSKLTAVTGPSCTEWTGSSGLVSSVQLYTPEFNESEFLLELATREKHLVTGVSLLPQE